MPDIPLRHHYVPVFYLKRWLLGGEKIVEFSRPYGDRVKPRRTHPSGTGYVDRLYELRGLPPELAQQVEEHIFRPVDSRAADVMEALHDGQGPRDIRDRMAWTQFLLTMLIRNPEEVRAMKAAFAKNWLLSSKRYERKYRVQRQEGDPATFAKYLAATPAEIVELNAMKAFVSSLTPKHTFDHIMRMKWGHFELPYSAPALLTSDRPIITEGLVKDDGHLVIPIGPKRLFYAVNNSATSDRILMLGPAELVRRVNLAVTAHAHNQVYATTDHPLPFVQTFMSVDRASILSERFGDTTNRKRIKQTDLQRGKKLLSEP